MVMTPSLYMQSDLAQEKQSHIRLIGYIEETERQRPDSPQETISERSSSPDLLRGKYFHQRVHALRLSAKQVAEEGSTPGLTQPYCPAGPTLFRSGFDNLLTPTFSESVKEKSPLRKLQLSNYSLSVNKKVANQKAQIKYDLTVEQRRLKMPHAVSLPHSGFQALILCGPGIGLSTFTSVPSEFPKALINVANRPMVWYVLDWCYRMGVTDITLITPPTAKPTIAAALAQNPYLTSLPSPSPDLLAPADLEHTTPTAELLRLPEVQSAIKSDFLLLPCDLICDISGDAFLEMYLSSIGGLGGVSAQTSTGSSTSRTKNFVLGGEGSGRRGGLSLWYETTGREESVKNEECDFMGTANLDAPLKTILPKSKDLPRGKLRKLVYTTPMSELWDNAAESKAWNVRQSLTRKYGSVKCMTTYRDSHIYMFPYWVKEFAICNEDFESVSEDLVGTWAKGDWRKPSYRARFGVQDIFQPRANGKEDRPVSERPIDDELDLLSLSSTQVSQHQPNTSFMAKQKARLASRVQANLEDSILSPNDGSDDEGDSNIVPIVPSILSYVLSPTSETNLVRRVDTTPLLLSVSLLLAKIPSLEDSAAANASKASTTSPFAHASKVALTATIAPRVTISRSDTLIDSNSSIATQCVIKSSVIGSSVSIGTGSRITNCVIMDGATIGDKCVLTGTVIGKKANIGNNCSLQACEVQDGNAVPAGTEDKNQKYLIGGLDEMHDGAEDSLEYDDEADGDEVIDDSNNDGIGSA